MGSTEQPAVLSTDRRVVGTAHRAVNNTARQALGSAPQAAVSTDRSPVGTAPRAEVSTARRPVAATARNPGTACRVVIRQPATRERRRTAVPGSRRLRSSALEMR